MAVVVWRAYNPMGSKDDLDDLNFSVVCDDSSAVYVTPQGSSFPSRRYIDEVLERYWDNDRPTTADEWARLARTKLFLMWTEVDTDYSTVAQAIKGESALVNQAQKERDLLDEPMSEEGQKILNDLESVDTSTSMTAAAPSCPGATQDISLNIANRQKAIDAAGYGPLNPKDPNVEFWRKKAERWGATYNEAKRSVCGNCSAFIRTPSMLDCIESGLAAGDGDKSDAWDTINSGELGYCEAFDFKCAASRTCDAWIVGGPVTEEK